MNVVPSYLPGPPSRILTSSKGPDKLNESLDRLKRSQDAISPEAIAEAVAKAVKPVAEKIARAELAQGGVTVHQSLPGVPGPVAPTDQSKYRPPTDDSRKPDALGDVARQYQPPKTEEKDHE